MDPLFPGLPRTDKGELDLAALSALTDEELSAQLADAKTIKDRIVAQDPELLGDLSAADVLEEMKFGVSAILAMKEIEATKIEAETNFAAELAAQNALVEAATLAADDGDDGDDSGDDGSGDGDGDAPDADATLASNDGEGAAEAALEPDAEAVTASSNSPGGAKPLRRLPAAGRHVAVTKPDQNFNGMSLMASAGIEGFRTGEILDEGRLGQAMAHVAKNSARGPGGNGERIVVAHAEATMPEYRRLRLDASQSENNAKIASLTAAAAQFGVTDDAQALTASGGICAPVTPYYQLANVSTAERPVRDALVGFIADRGGINFAPPPVLGDITTAVGIITAEQDAGGGSTGTKTCQTVICPDFSTVDVDSVFHCVTAGNLGARAFPEQIAQFNALVLAAHARVAETNLLNKIKAGSTAVTANGQAVHNDGATATLLNDILVAAAGIRSRNRMTQNARLTAILPAWTADMLVGDLVASQFQRFQYTQAGVEQLLGSFNVSVSWTLDGPSDGTPQVFGSQGAAGVVSYPTAIQWALFPPGSWLFLDSGVLELGIVRDSVLNATNSYQIFGESWENAAGIGVESLWITSTVCPSGVVSAAAAPAGC